MDNVYFSINGKVDVIEFNLPISRISRQFGCSSLRLTSSFQTTKRVVSPARRLYKRADQGWS
jgi:hypothetical protein